jgi:hypothetical protein
LNGQSPWRRFARPEAGIFLAVWLLLLVAGQSRLFRDPGTFWHTRVGEIVLDSGQLVHNDPFSFTSRDLKGAPGESWIPHQWLGEIIMAVLYRLGGWDVLQLVTVTILAGLYTWIAHRLIVAGLHWSLAASIMVLPIAAGASHFHIRPHLATMVFFGTTFAFLLDFEAGRIELRRLFWLVPVYVFWINLHGGMLGGLITIGLALAGWTAFRLLGWDSPVKNARTFGVLTLLIGACATTAFVNPYGWRLPGVWLNIMEQKRLTEMIIEHAPLDPMQADGMMVLCVGFVYLIVFGEATRRRWQRGERPRLVWLLPFVWLYLACTRIRHASLFGIAAGLGIADMFPETSWAEAITKAGSDLFDAARGKAAQKPGILPFLTPALVVLAAFGLKAKGVGDLAMFGAGWADFNPTTCPKEMTPFLATEPEGTPIFNELNFGGYLIFFAPKVRVFLDDRCELYGEDFLLEYSAAERDLDRVERFLKPFKFNVALTQHGTAFEAYFRDRGWEVVHEGPTATLFRRGGGVPVEQSPKSPAPE